MAQLAQLRDGQWADSECGGHGPVRRGGAAADGGPERGEARAGGEARAVHGAQRGLHTAREAMTLSPPSYGRAPLLPPSYHSFDHGVVL